MLPRRFYEKYVKPCKGLKQVELPSIAPNTAVRIEKTLLDWRICYTPWGRKQETHISCDSELEAKYLSVWMKYGVNEIGMPKGKEDLEKIVPLLEKLEKQVKDVLDEDLVGYSPKIQKELTYRIWEVPTQ